jgi:hypothetical protein
MSVFKTKKFQKLKDKWYKKLERNGFEDIEQNENALKVWESQAFSDHRYNRHTFAEKQEYYSLAGRFYHEHEFESKKIKEIWRLHSEGLSLSAIYEKVKTKKRGFSRPNIHLIIKKLEKEMFKKYAAK